MMRIWRCYKWTILFGAAAGVLFANLMTMPLVSLYDRLNPVVSFHGELVTRDANSVIIKVSGTKNRDCVFVPGSIHSFVRNGGMLFNAQEQKIDEPKSRSRPLGPAYLGMWRVWPVGQGPQTLLMYVEHNCSGRMIMTEIVNLELP